MSKRKEERIAPGEISGRYFLRKRDKSGKAYFLDRSGKRVSADKVKASKRKVYDVGKDGKVKVPAPPLTTRKAKAAKVERDQYAFDQSVYGQNVAGNLAAYLANGYDVMIKANGKYTKATKADIDRMQRFMGEVFNKVFEKIKKLTGTSNPQTKMKQYEHSLNDKAVIDLDDVEIIDEEVIDEIFEDGIDPDTRREINNMKQQYKRSVQKYW